MGAQIDFYLLSDSTQEAKDIYACRIANRAFAGRMKTYLHTETDAHAEALDQKLWTFSQSSFVPHAIYRGQTLDPTRYPVQIGVQAAPEECAQVLISLRDEATQDYARFARVIEIIADEPAQKARGRERFRFYRAQGIEPNTHQLK